MEEQKPIYDIIEPANIMDESFEWLGSAKAVEPKVGIVGIVGTTGQAGFIASMLQLEKMKEDVIIIDGGRNMGKSMITEKLKEAGAEVMELGDIPHGLIQHEIMLPPPTISVYGAEKKKKKPCTYHEYVFIRSEEISPNMYKEIWQCRHCHHLLK